MDGRPRGPGGRGENDVAFRAANADAGTHSPYAHYELWLTLAAHLRSIGITIVCDVAAVGGRVHGDFGSYWQYTDVNAASWRTLCHFVRHISLDVSLRPDWLVHITTPGEEESDTQSSAVADDIPPSWNHVIESPAAYGLFMLMFQANADPDVYDSM